MKKQHLLIILVILIIIGGLGSAKLLSYWGKSTGIGEIGLPLLINGNDTHVIADKYKICGDELCVPGCTYEHALILKNNATKQINISIDSYHKILINGTWKQEKKAMKTKYDPDGIITLNPAEEKKITVITKFAPLAEPGVYSVDTIIYPEPRK